MDKVKLYVNNSIGSSRVTVNNIVRNVDKRLDNVDNTKQFVHNLYFYLFIALSIVDNVPLGLFRNKLTRKLFLFQRRKAAF